MSVIFGEVKVENNLPIVSVSNIQISYSAGQLVGNIHWVPVNTLITITADVPLPDGVFMTMFEVMVNATEVIKDIRRPASINNGLMTLEVRFKESGNPVLSSERLNKGLAIIGAPFRLNEFRIEFDIYDEA